MTPTTDDTAQHGQGAPAAVAPAGQTPGDLEKKLEQLKGDLAATEKQLVDFAAKKGVLNADIATLKSAVTDNDQLVKDYDKQVGKLLESKADIDKYAAMKDPMIVAALGGKEKADQVEAKVQAVETSIETKKGALNGLATAKAEKAKDHLDAQAALKASETAYADAKKRLAWQQARLAEVQALRKQLEEQGEKQNAPAMYVLLRELKRLAAIEIKTTEQYAALLAEAANDRDLKTNAERVAKEALEAASRALEAAEKDRAESEAKRLQAMLEAVKPN